MKKILVTGSLAYDHIMDFPGEFEDHILPDKVHVLNVSFAVNGVSTKHGGTAGNIAYNLALLSEKSTILGAVGKDFDKTRLESLGIDTSLIKTFEEKTASVHIITDRADNQISAYNAGAAKHLAELDVEGEFDMAILAPSNPEAMLKWSGQLREKKIPFIFDPGQQIINFSKEQLKSSCSDAILITLNDYEYEIFKQKAGDPLDYSDLVLVTKGPEGSVFLTKDGEIKNAPVTPEPLVDPTGAGDAVRAALIKGLLYDYSLEDIGKLASLLGTYAAEHKGTQEHKFSIEELKTRFKKEFGISLRSSSKRILILSIRDTKDDRIDESPKNLPANCLHKTIGIGQVSAAVDASKHIHTTTPELVILIGTCGSINKNFKQGDIIIGSKFINGDYDATDLFPDSNSQVIESEFAKKFDKYKSATIYTSSVFCSEEKKKSISGADVIDMESYAVAKACEKAGVPCLIVRVVSDNFEGEAGLDYFNFLGKKYNPDKTLKEVISSLASLP